MGRRLLFLREIVCDYDVVQSSSLHIVVFFCVSRKVWIHDQGCAAVGLVCTEYQFAFVFVARIVYSYLVVALSSRLTGGYPRSAGLATAQTGMLIFCSCGCFLFFCCRIYPIMQKVSQHKTKASPTTRNDNIHA